MDWSSITSTVGAAFAVLLFLQSPQANAFLPPEFHSSLRRLLRRFYKLFSNYIYFTVDEYDGVTPNELYTAAQLHLSDTAASAARSARLTLPKNASAATCTIADNERILDTFEGTKIWWAFLTVERHQPGFGRHALPDEKRALRMCIHKSDRDKVMKSYIPHLRHRLQLLRLQRRERFLYTNLNSKDDYMRWRGKVWTSVPFKHPSNFTTLALDPQLKDSIKEDLMQFASAKEFYDRVGRAWKRGYLLYGPPGTGKSSMIAAMANFLEYDVYDLELTHVKSNSELRNLLVKTTNRSIIVIEDIDCSLDLTNERQKKKKKNVDNKDGDMFRRRGVEDENEKSMVTLSGLLNFVDGLWSCCGDERIFVFTTNHVDKIDKALLRPGRMDMHIELSYCCYEAFKILAKNYLGLKEEHDLFEDVRVALDEEGAAITPAEVSEVLTKERKNVEKALTCLVKEIKESKFKRQAEREEEEKKRKEREKEEEEEEKEEMEKKRRKEREKEKEEEEKEEEEEKKTKETNKGSKKEKENKNNKNEHEYDIDSSDDDEIKDKNDKNDVEDGLDEKLGKKKKNNHEFEEDEEDGKNSKMTKRRKSKDDPEEEEEDEDNEKENKNKKMSSEKEEENDSKKSKEKNKNKSKEDEEENKEKERNENNTAHQNGESLES